MPYTTPVTPDPRIFPDVASASASARGVYALAEGSLRAKSAQEGKAFDHELRVALHARLVDDGPGLAAILAGAPSIDVARHLWRAVDAVWRNAMEADPTGIAVTVFALPLVVIVGQERVGDAGALSGVLEKPERVSAILRAHGALAGNGTFALSNALVAADAIDVARLPEILAWRCLSDAPVPDAMLAARALPPAPLECHAGREAVHLRFLVGAAIAKPGTDLTVDKSVGGWRVPLTQELAAQLAAGQASVLALPRAPQHLLPAVAQGYAAQREVAAQVFASNAIRRFRGAVGEPTAVISAHRAEDAPGGGELRLSLCSPFEPAAAEGFRCPLYRLDRVGDVVAMLVGLLRDCRVTDIRTLAGVHADRVASTGLPLLFKPDTIPDSACMGMH